MPDDLAPLARVWLEARAAKAEALRLHDEAQAALVEAIAAADPADERYVYVDPDGVAHNLKVVRQVDEDIDEAKLESKVSLGVWRAITVRRIDRTKLHAALELGRIPQTIYRSCVTPKPKRPWVKDTVRATTAA